MTSHLTIAALGFLLIFLGTTAGAAAVFFVRRELSSRSNALMLGFAAGMMVAASMWSLLMPAIEQSASVYGSFGWMPVALGFVGGGLFLVLLDLVVPHIHQATQHEEGLRSHFSKSLKFFLAVTLHNIPEGMAVGFAFGAAAQGGDFSDMSALALAIGIALQNLPEGAAVALPMSNGGTRRMRAFLFGMGSGAVEPLMAIAGYLLAAQLVSVLPWLMAFAAGAMIFVVAEDLIPEANLSGHSHFATWGVMAGFVLMMVLDVALG